MDDLHDLGADILIDIIRYRNTVTGISAECDCGVNCLKKELSAGAGDDIVSYY